MRRKIVLACKECSSRNYSTEKKSGSSEERLTARKFCSNCNEHTLHRETK
ncbi:MULTISPECIES: 50S ribosomal protein L33 [Salimicrobium]|uniref:Large ribosomal subunit protein bL33 n=3 Tax=Salimicrobium TaxID=351195 RepID=K2GIU4_9BACI|nr:MULTISPECIES: 50S ribosomal protein L33 [Salimicrobium]EKE30394.1 50S ribosomal protein L33 [Salimicrobium jeotgali]MBM7696537.1 large subunit ribosomal protein L33 [Salimicrobium jeotgali]PBB05262.1 50S ribosomal protein L33 [Salimicrobium humidisoli]SDY24429.1 large subunit ribosomal protein L33 [Salimicrobium album]